MLTVDVFINILLTCSIPGLFGGLGSFLYALKNDHYRNNMLKIKFTVEIFGGTLMASFIGFLLPQKIVIAGSFVIGLVWAVIIQVLRDKVTRFVTDAIKTETE